MYLHQHNLIVLVIWVEYQDLEYFLCFHHELASIKGHKPTIFACFLDQGKHTLMLEQLINQTSQSHHCLFFLMSCNQVKELLILCIMFLIAASKYNVKNSLSGPPASNEGSPIKTI